MQDYLAAIYDLAGSGKPVIGARLAKHMGISAPAVTEAIHRMVRGNYVKVGRSKELTLTPRGRQVEGLHLHTGSYDGWFDISPVAGGLWATLGGYAENTSDDAP